MGFSELNIPYISNYIIQITSYFNLRIEPVKT